MQYVAVEASLCTDSLAEAQHRICSANSMLLNMLQKREDVVLNSSCPVVAKTRPKSKLGHSRPQLFMALLYPPLTALDGIDF